MTYSLDYDSDPDFDYPSQLGFNIMIEQYSFGRMTIQGRVYTEDVLICHQACISPWWRRQGHEVRVEDIGLVLEHRPEALILGQGQPGQMKASQEVRDHLGALGIELIQKPTREAVQVFNRRLEQGAHVCGGFHLTC